MACRWQARNGRVEVFLLGLLQRRANGLLTLLVAATAPAPAAAASFALLARLAGLLLGRRYLASPARIVRRPCALGLLLALLLTAVMPASILLRLTLILAVAPPVALTVQLLRLRALLALPPGLFATTLIAASKFAVAAFVPAATRTAIGRWGGSRCRTPFDRSNRVGCTFKETEYLADDRRPCRF